MKLYGIPYMGSKTKIAAKILELLPPGKRFVDLFGGGFAMSHAASLCHKWDVIYYNELNPLLPPLIKKAIQGDFNYNHFRPAFITRERFLDLKDKDGYIKYIWSFGNKGETYLFGENIEPLKHEAHDFIVFGKHTKHFQNIERYVNSKDIHTRRLQFCKACKKLKRRFDLQHLEQLERLQYLQHLQRLEQAIVINCGSYLKYEYHDGDVVYCDPPYEGPAEYSGGFNHEQFYEWVNSRNYQVWFSSYQGVKGFRLVWAKQLRSSLGPGNSSINFECLYTNR